MLCLSLAFRVAYRCVLGFVALSALGAPARAQEADHGLVSIDWRAPSGCPDRTEIEADVVRLLGERAVGRAGLEPLAVRADVAQDADGRWRVVISTPTGSRGGTRGLSGESCVAVARATALIVGMMIDPDVGMRLDAPSPPKPAPAAASERPRSEPVRVRPPESQPTRRWQGFVAPVFAVSTGLSPSWPLEFGARLGLRNQGSAVVLQGLRSLQTVASSDEDPALRGRFSLFSLGVGFCQTWGERTVVWGGCAAISTHRLHAEGDAGPPLRNHSRTAWFWTASGGGLFALRANRHLAFPVLAELLLPTRQPEFEFTGMGAVYRPARLGGRLSLAAELAFP